MFHPFDAEAILQVPLSRCGLFQTGQLHSKVRVLCGKVVKDGREQYGGDIDAKTKWGTLVMYLEGQCS